MFRIVSVYVDCSSHTHIRMKDLFISVLYYSNAYLFLFSRIPLLYRWKCLKNGSEHKAIDTHWMLNSIYADIACLNSWAIEPTNQPTNQPTERMNKRPNGTSSMIVSILCSLSVWICGRLVGRSDDCKWSVFGCCFLFSFFLCFGVQFLCLWLCYFQFYLKAFDHYFEFVLCSIQQTIFDYKNSLSIYVEIQ